MIAGTSRSPFELRRLAAPDAACYRELRLEGLRSRPEAFGASWEDEAPRPLDWFAERLERNAVFGGGSFASSALVGVAWLGQVLRVGSYDAVIVRNNLGGNGCLVMFYVVSVMDQGAKASPSFGTCSEAAEVSKRDDGVSLRMPTVSTLAQQRSGKGDTGKVYVFDVVNGVVMDMCGRPRWSKLNRRNERRADRVLTCVRP